MIIVSQDKEKIVNFNVNFSVYIREKYDYDKNETIGYNIFAKHFEDIEFLGTYKSKERAIQVLGEIIEAYDKSNEDFYVQESETRWEKGEEYLVGYRNKNTNKTYYMPLQ